MQQITHLSTGLRVRFLYCNIAVIEHICAQLGMFPLAVCGLFPPLALLVWVSVGICGYMLYGDSDIS